MSLFFDNFGGKPAWTTNTTASKKPASPYGQAQPVQPQSQGTPYGAPTKPPPPGMVYNKAPSSQATNFSAYAPPQQSAPQSNPFAQYNPQQMGNVFQQQSGLPSFQFTATDSFGNTYDNPAALTAQQGAMAQAMNAQRAQQIQSGSLGPLNPQAAYQQAQQMIQGGWTNPFAAQPVTPQDQGTPYGGGFPVDWSAEHPPLSINKNGELNPGWSVGPNGIPVQSGGSQTLYRPPAPTPGLLAPIPRPTPQPDPQRQRDQAAYDELTQQMRLGAGGKMIDSKRAALEKRLGMSQPVPPPSQGTPYGQPPSPSAPRGQTPPLPSEDEWRSMLGGSWIGEDGRQDFYNRGVSAGYVYDRQGAGGPRPGQAQPAPRPSQGAPYGQPSVPEFLATGGRQVIDAPISPEDLRKLQTGPLYRRSQQPVQPPSPGARYGAPPPVLYSPQTPSQAQPVQPPSQGTPYGSPFPVANPKSLPFYDQLFAGDKVTQRQDGGYDVADSSGRVVQRYTADGRLNAQYAGGRSGPLMAASEPGYVNPNQPDPAAERARQEEQWRTEYAPKWKRLEALTKAQSSKPVRDSRGNWSYNPNQPEIDRLRQELPGADEWFRQIPLASTGMARPPLPKSASDLNALLKRTDDRRAWEIKSFDLQMNNRGAR